MHLEGGDFGENIKYPVLTVFVWNSWEPSHVVYNS